MYLIPDVSRQGAATATKASKDDLLKYWETESNTGRYSYGEAQARDRDALIRRVLAIDEKALGPDDPETKTVRTNLQALIDKQSDKQKEN